jgi:hypothetical protein
MPERTTIVLPLRLKQRATALARKQKISFSEFVRQSLQRAVFEPERLKRARARDPFWTNVPVYDGPGPTDVSANVDKYLYDEDS